MRLKYVLTYSIAGTRVYWQGMSVVSQNLQAPHCAVCLVIAVAVAKRVVVAVAFKRRVAMAAT